MTPPEVRRGLDGLLQSAWYGRSVLAWLLSPLALLFGLGVACRHFAYRAGLLRTHRPGVPVIVVGNITVGGTGKTPVVAWLVEVCRGAGMNPGIVSRGYGGQAAAEPRMVSRDDDPSSVGDEPLLLRRQTGAPVCVHADRVAAARRLAREGVDVVIADDGLQHYRLHRDLEIAVLDGERRLGNGFLLPAGPLREPAARLREVDFVLVNGGRARDGEVAVGTRAGMLRSLDGRAETSLAALAGQRVRAVAGIGNPGRFHTQLEEAGLHVEPVPVADHGKVDLAALSRASAVPIVMTEKDAVKYRAADAACPVWVAGLEVTVPATVAAAILGRLAGARQGQGND